MPPVLNPSPARRTAFVSALFFATVVALAPAQPSAASTFAPPAGTRKVDFDDFLAPSGFSATTALSNRYAPLGITFAGVGANGGAVLNGVSFTVTGESGLNFLAFNTASHLTGGVAVPSMPETLAFRNAVDYVQMNVAGDDGDNLHVDVYDEDNNVLGGFDYVLSPAMQTIAFDYARMSRLVVTTSAGVVAIDDVAFSLAPTLVDFDDVTAPALFSSAAPAREEYVGKGVRFYGSSASDGAAILDEDNAWGSLGTFSAPNILAINTVSQFGTGGHPDFPEWMTFDVPVREVSFRAAGTPGSTLKVQCGDKNDTTIVNLDVVLATSTQLVSFSGDGILACSLSSTDSSYLVLDDLQFRQEGTMIDFDDATEASDSFGSETALRNRYAALGIRFEASGNDGPAILDESGGFLVSGYSAPKFLAWNFFLTLADGGTPSMQVTAKFDRPLKALQFLTGSDFGGSMTILGYDAVGTKVVSSSTGLASKAAPVSVQALGATEISLRVNSSDTQYGILDNLAFQFTDPCVHDVCYVGDGLDPYCDACATKVCDNTPSCCSGTWTLACAQQAESTCSLTCLPLCGDANDDRKVTSTDALAALRTAVGSGSCPTYRCDYNGDGSVKSGDALQILKKAVGQTPVAKCPAPLL